LSSHPTSPDRWLTPSLKRHLLGHMRPTHARRWLHTPHPHLGHVAPIELARAGQETELVAVLAQDRKTSNTN